MGPSSDEDGDGALGVGLAVSASDIRIVGLILYVFGHHSAVLLVPLPKEGVGDIDGVVLSAVAVIVNEADRWSVRVLSFCLALVVDAALLVLFHRK